MTRYSNVIAAGDLAATGNRNRDLLVTVVSLRGGATVSQAPSYTTGASYFEGQVMLPNLASNASQVVFRLDFVTVGGTAADPIDVPVYLRSIDTDGNLSSITGGVTERIEYMPPSVTVIAGSQLESATAYDGGVAFRAKVCTTADALIGCSAVGNYPTYSLATAPASVAAEANYSAGVSSMTFAFGGEIPAAGSGGTAYLPRLFGMQGGILVAPNMTAAVTIAPTVAGPGSTVNGSLVCTNRGTSAATSATCTASALDSAGAAVAVTVGACTASSGSAASLPASATLSCPISYTQPGTANSGTNAAPTGVTVTATTSAANEPAGSTADNSATDSVDTIDAIDDTAVSTPAGTATSVSVLGNDQVGTVLASTSNVTLSQISLPAVAGLSFSTTTGTMAVTAATPVGSYVLTYQICSNPAQTPAACDQATATINVTAGPNMTTVVAIAPTIAGPGASVSGNITCTNSGGGAATSATCTASALDSAGAAVAVTVGACTASSGSAASLPASATLTCPISYTQPGTANSGTNAVPTSVTVTATTSAANEPAGSTADNSATDSVDTIDAIDDAAVSTPAGTATSVSVLGNDQVGTALANTGNVTLTQVSLPSVTGLSFNTATGVLSSSAATPVGSYVLTYQICSNPAQTPAACDQATATINVTAGPNMTTVVAIAPTIAGPGASVSGNITCTNSGGGAATSATCTASALDSTGAAVAVTVGACTASSGSAASLPASATLSCPISYTQPGTANSGTNAAPTSVTVTATTSASNEPSGSTADNSATDSVETLDAIDDAAVSTPAGTATSVSVLGNDQVGTALASTSNVTLSQISLPAVAGLSFSTTTGTMAVTAATPVGSYVLTYQICSNPAQSPAACDQATATIDVTAGPNMTTVVAIAPSVAGPGASVSGSITCTNAGSAAATSATCTASAQDSTGAAVAVTVGACTASSGSAASLPASATLSCPISYTQPGTANSGTNAVPTSVTVTATTSAANEPAGSTADNSATDSVETLDAIDDAAVSTPAGTATSVSVLGNDQVGTALASTSNVTLSQISLPAVAGLSFNTATSTMAVTAATPVGSYVLTYQICSNPAQSPAACDQATATIDVTAGPNMTPVVAIAPSVAGSGASVSGSITCTNAGSAAATSATCTASAQDSTGAAVAVTVGACTASSGSAASLPASATLSCPISYTQPGTANSGTNAVPTSVTVTATTSAANEPAGSTADNSATDSVETLDAIDDAAVSTPAGTATSLSVLGNDQVGTALASTSNVTLSQISLPAVTGLSFNTATGVLSSSAATPVGSYVLTYQICSNPAQSPAACDQATATINVTAGPNMTPVVAIAPSVTGPGASVSGSITCTNSGGGAATNATCTASAQDSTGAAVAVTVGACTASSGSAASLPASATLSCPISYTQPGSANSGTNAVPTSVTVTATTSAANEPAGSTADNSATDSVETLDAIDDAAVSTPAGTATSLSVLGNDQVGTALASTSNVTLSQISLPAVTGLSFNTATGVLSSSAATPVGSYVLTYQICSNPAQTPAACDQATATIDVTAGPNMTPVVAIAPTIAGPGASVSGSITCTNSGGGAATSATCTASALDSTGASVAVTVGACTASSGSAASLPVNATLTCPISYTQPGTANSGTNAVPTSVTVTATTSAANEPAGSTADNSATDSVETLDAIDDAAVSTPAGTATSLSVLGNDQVGTALASTSNVTLSQISLPAVTGLSFNTATGVLSSSAATPVGSYVLTYQICSNPAQTPAACDQATATIDVTAGPNMTPVVAIAPTIAGPGASVSGSITCTNSGGGAATSATCTASALDSTGASVAVTVGACTASSGSAASLPVNATLTCPISYTQPGTANSGTNAVPTSVTVTATTSAANEPAGSTADNSATDSVETLDAIDDAAVSTPAGTATSLSVLGNDQVGTALASTSNVTLSQISLPAVTGLSFSTTTGTMAVTAATPVGSYVLTYQICSNPAQTPAACDQATATINVTAGPNMTPVVAIAPSVTGPGASVSGSITCTNSGGGAATNATCTASAQDSTGAAVAVTVGACTASSGSAASLPASATLTCPISYTQPGTANSGTNAVPTSVTVTATTSAANEPAGSTADNSATDSVETLDAIDDAAVSTPAGTATSLSVLGNDQVGTALASTSNVTLSQISLPAVTGLSFNTATGVLSSSAATPVGSYVLTYQICSNPAQTPAACDQATATLNVTSPPDMAAVISGLPSQVRPGQVVNGLTLTCTNLSTSTSATAAVCALGTVTGATASTPVCSPTPGGNVAAGAAIVCSFNLTVNGNQGGADEPTTSVSVAGSTGASNDSNPANNNAAASATVIDAVDDSAAHPGGSKGQSSNLATNDQYPSGSVFSIVAGGSCANPGVSGSGTATYDVPNTGSCTVNYQVCAPSPNQGTCDTATLTVTAQSADMAAVISGLPSQVRPGQVVNGLTLTCTNLSTSTSATAAVCALGTVTGATASTPVCSPTPGGNVAAGAAIVCSFNLTVNGNQGGADEPTTSVGVAGSTGASNDSNPANNNAAASATVIDAVDDSAAHPGGSKGQSSNLATNDQYPSGSVFSVVAGGSCANPGVSGSGTATYDVPNTGSCTVNYQVCAPSPNQATCDTATLIVTAQSADMAAAISGLPSQVRPGQVVNGVTLTCTNVSTSSSATAAACALGTVTGATASTPVCSPTPGGNVAAGAAIVCSFNLTINGSQGGADEPTTSVGVAGSTGASNDSNPANNNAAASATVIDAVDDSAAHPGGSKGQSSNLATNDQYPSGSVFSIVAGGSCANPGVSGSGTATYDVPASGTCTVNYQVCAPSPNQTTCDTATLIVTAQSADMAAVISGLPAVLSPGQVVADVALTCRNAAGGAAATSPTCVPNASVGRISAVTCAPVAPATLASGEAIVCRFSYTAPGVPGGTAEVDTSVTLTGTTGALNDADLANNTATASAKLIDAVDDGLVTVASTGGAIDVWPNDRVGGVVASVPAVTATLTDAGGLVGVSLDASGRIQVPAGTASGRYALSYRLCSVELATACDTATLTVQVQGAPDLVVAKTHSPAVFTEGGRGHLHHRGVQPR